MNSLPAIVFPGVILTLVPLTLAAFVLSKSFVILPLSIVCIAVVIAIPAAAARAHLHIPGYVGLAFLSFALALLLGWLSGTRAIAGTTAGLLLSLVFFLLIAAAVGSVVALFFYRHPPEV